MIFKSIPVDHDGCSDDIDRMPIDIPSSPPVATYNSLTALPSEILVQIFLSLGFSDRFSLISCCKFLREVYEGSPQLQYQLTLWTSGYRDVSYLRQEQGPMETQRAESGPSRNGKSKEVDIPSVKYMFDRHPSSSKEGNAVGVDSLSALEKNTELKDREERWRTIDPVCERELRISGPVGVYELQEGVFLMCDDYLLEDEGRPRSIRLIPLPSAEDPNVEHTPIALKSHKFPFSIADLTMDPTQDLIVVSEHHPAPARPSHPGPTHRYHLLSMSTFQPHPLAALPALDFPPRSQQQTVRTRQLLQVMDETLVIMVTRYTAVPWMLAGLGHLGHAAGMGNEEEIICWNWKTGRVLARLSLPNYNWFSSFALLTPTTFALTTISTISPIFPSEPPSLDAVFPPVIQIWSFASDPYRSINPSQPLQHDYMDDTTPRPVVITELGLPAMTPNTEIVTFDMRPDPAFPQGRSRGVGLNKGFIQDPEKGVMVFDLQAITLRADEDQAMGHNAASKLDIFVLREFLVQHAKAGEKRLAEMRVRVAEDPKFIWRVEESYTWAQWGEQNARIMDMSTRDRNWVCSCSGYRYVSLVPPPNLRFPMRADASSIPDESDIRILDFSPMHVRKRLSNRADEDQPIRNVLQRYRFGDLDQVVRSEPNLSTITRVADTELLGSPIWKESVRSRLPYVEIRRKKAIPANDIMMDDQRIILTRTFDNDDDHRLARQEMVVLCF